MHSEASVEAASDSGGLPWAVDALTHSRAESGFVAVASYSALSSSSLINVMGAVRRQRSAVVGFFVLIPLGWILGKLR